MKKRVAIVGGGIAGLTAAYLLNLKHDIVLFEKEHRLGGNAYTLTSRDGISFDIAAAVFGKNSYRNFYKLLSMLKVETARFSSIGFNIKNLDTNKGLYFTPLSLRALVAQKFAMYKPCNLFSMLGGILPMKKAQRLYRSGQLEGLTMEQTLAKVPKFFGDSKLFTMFMLCLVSSMYYDEVMKAPASFFIEKITAHKDFFSPKALYSLFIAKANTQSYVNALALPYRDKIVLNSKIRRIARPNGRRILVEMADGKESYFEDIVFACNADQALSLLENPTDKEKRLLGPWKYKEGPIVVHKDGSLLPDRDLCRMFTCVYTKRNGNVHTSVNGHTWNLAGVPNNCPYTSTQHPNYPIREDLIEFKKTFRTPIYDADSVATIKELPKLNGELNTYYCGSHFGFGLHEDAVTSAIHVAQRLGATGKEMGFKLPPHYSLSPRGLGVKPMI